MPTANLVRPVVSWGSSQSWATMPTGITAITSTLEWPDVVASGARQRFGAWLDNHLLPWRLFVNGDQTPALSRLCLSLLRDREERFVLCGPISVNMPEFVRVPYVVNRRDLFGDLEASDHVGGAIETHHYCGHAVVDPGL